MENRSVVMLLLPVLFLSAAQLLLAVQKVFSFISFQSASGHSKLFENRRQRKRCWTICWAKSGTSRRAIWALCAFRSSSALLPCPSGWTASKQLDRKPTCSPVSSKISDNSTIKACPPLSLLNYLLDWTGRRALNSFKRLVRHRIESTRSPWQHCNSYGEIKGRLYLFFLFSVRFHGRSRSIPIHPDPPDTHTHSDC